MLAEKEIFEICSPCVSRKLLKGPYAIVYNDPDGEFAIVAIEYRVEEGIEYVPCLGFRWMVVGDGNPVAFGNKLWMVLPGVWSSMLIEKYVKDSGFADILRDFLHDSKVTTGQMLKEYYFNHVSQDKSVILNGDGHICDSKTNVAIQRNRFNP